MGLGDRSHGVEDLPGALLIHERKVELGAAGAFRLLVFAAELAGEQAAGERAPDQQAGLFSFEQRDDFALQVAAGDGVVGLQGVEASEILELRDAQGFGDFPGLPVGAADVADLALVDEVSRARRVSSTGVTGSLAWIW